MKKGAKIRTHAFVLALGMVWFLAHAPSAFTAIIASATPSKLAPATGQIISVAISVDMSDTPELLGALSATLTWNPEVLRFAGQSTGEDGDFARTVCNEKKVSEGIMPFAGLNPHGSGKLVNLLRVNFEVTGEAGSSPDLMLEMKEMYAAKTLTDLMPMLDQSTLGPAAEFSVLELPEEFELMQNYPNPFNAGTEIRFGLPEDSQLRLTIFNLLGERITTLVDEDKKAGRYTIHWDGTDSSGTVVSSGIYIYRLETEEFKAQKRMLFLK